MPTVLQYKYSGGASNVAFDNPIGIGHRLVLYQAGRDTPSAGDIAHLAGQGWTHLATCTNATGFERGGAFYWKTAEATNENWDLDAPDLEYVLLETNATVETPVVVATANTVASSANMDCGGSFTPAEGDDFLAIGGASVGASDNDYDSLPNPITPYTDVDSGDPGGHWNSFSPLMWVGYLSDSSASGSYVVGGTNGRPRTYCGITILLASSPPPAEVAPPFVCVLDDADLSELACVPFEELLDLKIRIELQGTGYGNCTVHRSADVADEAILKTGNWAAVTIPQIQPDPIFLVQVETDKTQLISEDEEGGEDVQFAGRGPLSYLERAKAWPRTFASGSGTSGLSTNGGNLHGPASTGNKAGQILNRSLEEWQATDRGVADVGRRIQPIKHLTKDFDYTDDSDGNPWATTAMTAELSQGRVGETGLQGILELIGTGEIDILMWPDLSIQGFNAYGRDLTATDFAADKVIFRRGVNIAEGLARQFGPVVVPTDTIVQGDESTWAFASSPTAGDPGVPDVEGYVAAPGTDTAALEEIGLADMRRRLRQGESVAFQIDVPKFGDEPDPENGLYLPGPPGSNGQFWIGDTVTLDTGSGFRDFDNIAVRVMAISITLDDAGDLIVAVELKATTILGRFGATTGTPGGGGFGVGTPPSTAGGGSPSPTPANIQAVAALNAVNDHKDDAVAAHVASAVDLDGSGFTELADTIDDVQEFAEAVDVALAAAGGGGGGGGSFTRTQLGTTSIGGSFDTAKAYYKKITVPASGLIASISVAVKGQSSNGANPLVGLMSDNAGTPLRVIAIGSGGGTRRDASNNVFGGPLMDSTARFVTVPLNAWVAAGDYWLVVNGAATAANDYQVAFSSGTGSDRTEAGTDAIYDHSIAGGSTAGTNDYSIYADFIQTALTSEGQYISRRLFSSEVSVTDAINSAAYLDYFLTEFGHDWDQFPATHFRITARANSNASGQSILLQLTPAGAPTNPVSAAGDDITIPFNGGSIGWVDSGWIPVSDAMAGFDQLQLAVKGTNSTVDLVLRTIDIHFKNENPQAVGIGTAFPGSPATNQRFFRTDLGGEYFYDGARWLSSQLFHASMPGSIAGNTGFTASSLLYAAAQHLSEGSIFIERMRLIFYASGLSGSAYWSAQMVKVTAAEAQTNVGSSVTIQSGTSSNYLLRATDINEVVDLSSHPVIAVSVTKTGSPGTLLIQGGYIYRLVG